jgi:serine/threonine protein kinase
MIKYDDIPESTKYSLIDIIGQGGFGTVYRGTGEGFKKTLVLKTVVNVNFDKKVPRFLMHEYELLKNLDHPNIIHVYDLCKIKGQVFFVMEFFDALQMDEIFEFPTSHSPRDLRRLLIVVSQILDALHYLHHRGIIHCSLSPNNILIDEDLHVKIVDFEHARLPDEDESHLWPEGIVSGIPYYMAPEQILGNSIGPATDFYALGMILIQILYGDDLFNRHSVADILRTKIENEIDENLLVEKGVSGPMSAILAPLLLSDPQKRLSNHKKLLKLIIESFEAEIGSSTSLSSTDKKKQKSGKAKNPQTIKYYDWDIAFSFANEDRRVVEEIVQNLKKKGLKIFYDFDHQSKLWGEDLPSFLENVYTKQAKFCVIVISQSYPHKNWAWFESRYALSREITQRHPYILPLRLDDTKIPGIPHTIGIIDIRRNNVSEITKMLVEKVRTFDNQS